MSEDICPGEWIEWKGGDCPVPADTIVEILFRAEAADPSAYVEGEMPAGECDWEHRKRKHDLDIVAYRVIPSQVPHD